MSTVNTQAAAAAARDAVISTAAQEEKDKAAKAAKDAVLAGRTFRHGCTYVTNRDAAGNVTARVGKVVANGLGCAGRAVYKVTNSRKREVASLQIAPSKQADVTGLTEEALLAILIDHFRSKQQATPCQHNLDAIEGLMATRRAVQGRAIADVLAAVPQVPQA